MITSLRVRQFVAYGFVLVAAFTVLAVLETRVQRRWLLDRSREELVRDVRQVAVALADDPPEVRAAPQGTVAALDSALARRITLIAPDGRVIADSRADAHVLENHANRPEFRAAMAGRVGTSVRRSHTLGVEMLYVAEAAPPGMPWAVVRLSEPLSVVHELNGALMRISLLGAGFTLLATFALVYWIGGRPTGRVRELQRIAERIGSGDPRARADERPDDELGRLGAALNHMSATLNDRLEALARERDEREHVLAHMSDGVALLDPGNRIVHCNHSLAELFAAPRPAAPGTPLGEFVREPELDELVRRARAERRPLEAELRLWSPRARFVRANVTPLDPAASELLLVLHDLTEAETVNRVRQDFVANVSHELRTPLTSLRGYAETLLDGGLEDAEHREQFVRVIRDQAERMQLLVDDLLSLAQLERPEAAPKREPFDLRALLAEHVAAEQPRARAAGLALVLEPGPPLEVSAERHRLAQVIANLLDNALKYTERGGITVRAGEDARRVWCEVEDTGPGIPEDDRSRVFERFYRVDKARSREKGGTGLGLSIVKHVITLHGGEVSVRSAPGEGSCFRFELPRP